MHAENISFKNQLQEAVNAYPNLVIKKDDRGWDYLSGILDVPNDEGKIVGAFMVEIHGTEYFPMRFPKLFETGGEIPMEAAWHRNMDESCCITVPPDEILKCKAGISVKSYIQDYAIPYFANQIHRKITGEYKNGEYAHNLNGLEQYYSSLLKTKNRRLWLRYFCIAFRGLNPQIQPEQTCFCGSRMKFISCHFKAFESLKSIGESDVINHFIHLINEKAIIYRLLKRRVNHS
jgi:hypothetical protein